MDLKVQLGVLGLKIQSQFCLHVHNIPLIREAVDHNNGQVFNVVLPQDHMNHSYSQHVHISDIHSFGQVFNYGPVFSFKVFTRFIIKT